MNESSSDFAIAVVTTVYQQNSHADVIVSRWLDPRPDDPAWGWPRPRSRIASMYIDQYPEGDMGRNLCAEHGVSLHDTVAAALCRGGDHLAVDAVLLIGEHGDYPHNDIGQHLYPRKELFDEIVAVFDASGRSVPVFCDKHLSWNFDWALQMDRTARDMGFMLVSSSSIPLCRRVPNIDLAGRDRVREAVAVFFGGDEAYGYHGYEFAQAIIERRAGGEAGIEAFTVYRGDDVWRQLDAGRWSNKLMDAALEAIRHENASKLNDGDVRDNCAGDDLTAVCVEHCDGMRATHLNLSGHASNWSIALEIDGHNGPLTSAPTVDDGTYFHAHFATMGRTIEDAFLQNRPPFAPQRSLITAGITAFTMQGRANPSVRLASPALCIAYDPLPYDGQFSLNAG